MRQTITGHQDFTSCHLQCIEALAGAAHSGEVRNAMTAALAMGLMATAPSLARAASDDTPNIAREFQAARTRVGVRVYDNGTMPATDQTVALRAAAGVLAAAGIDVMWLHCEDDASQAPPSRAGFGGQGNSRVCETPVVGSQLSVRLVRLPGTPSARGQLQLGYSLVDTTAGEGTLATIYVDRVHWLAGQAGADAAVLLGFAIAHEVGHLLLGTSAHAASGLMRAVWSRAELQGHDRADWLFSPEEASRMKSSIARRDGLISSERDANGCLASGGDAAHSSTECGPDAAPVRRVAARTD